MKFYTELFTKLIFKRLAYFLTDYSLISDFLSFLSIGNPDKVKSVKKGIELILSNSKNYVIEVKTIFNFISLKKIKLPLSISSIEEIDWFSMHPALNTFVIASTLKNDKVLERIKDLVKKFQSNSFILGKKRYDIKRSLNELQFAFLDYLDASNNPHKLLIKDNNLYSTHNGIIQLLPDLIESKVIKDLWISENSEIWLKGNNPQLIVDNIHYVLDMKKFKEKHFEKYLNDILNCIQLCNNNHVVGKNFSISLRGTQVNAVTKKDLLSKLIQEVSKFLQKTKLDWEEFYFPLIINNKLDLILQNLPKLKKCYLLYPPESEDAKQPTIEFSFMSLPMQEVENTIELEILPAIRELAFEY